MSSRKRQSATATPAARRAGNETTPTVSAAARPRDATFPLPAYEAPLAPLNAKAQQELENLLVRTYPARKIEVQLKRASSALEECTGEINDRLMEKDATVKKLKARRERDGADDMELDEKENEELESMKKKVDAMTERMDMAIRRCIDGEAGLTSLEKSLKDVHRNATLSAQQQPPQSQRNTQPPRVPSDDDDEGDNSNAADDLDVTQPGATARTQTQTQTQQASTPAPPSLMPLLSTTLQTHTDAYTAQPLRTRYASHPSYVSFERTTFEAQHPGPEAPPMPHASTWFVKEERKGSPAPGTQRGASGTQDADADADIDDAASDTDDIAIDRVRISTRCPLTLREFEDPVTAQQKCGHSFEREAIYSMLADVRPPTRGPRAQRAAWVPTVKCPVAGCDAALAKDDLVTDLVLVRRIRRIQRAREGRGGDDGDDVDDSRVLDDDEVLDEIEDDTVDGQSQREDEEIDDIEDELGI